jgi:hypothetical protein
VQQVLVCDPQRNALLKEGSKSDEVRWMLTPFGGALRYSRRVETGSAWSGWWERSTIEADRLGLSPKWPGSTERGRVESALFGNIAGKTRCGWSSSYESSDQAQPTFELCWN